MVFPLARLITPNIPEAEIISGREIADEAQLEETAAQLARRFSLSVLAKGGHLENDSLVDILYDYEMSDLSRFTNQKVTTLNTHGTGCTLSSALASFLARGLSLIDATDRAIGYINISIKAGAAYRLGEGHGPVHHFHEFWG
jgi:hydroxymethylpyrimidine/phosphomethylpyrimidine kinase